MLKKILSGLLIITILVSLVACKNDVNSKSSYSDKPIIPANKTNVLPEFICSSDDIFSRYDDIITLKDGSVAVVGYKDMFDESGRPIAAKSLIRIYDKDNKLKNEYIYDTGNGFTQVAACSDGGFILSSYSPPYLTKLNSNFETEWVGCYEAIEFEGNVCDIEEISSNCYAVLYISVNSSDFTRCLKLSFIDNNGTVVDTMEVLSNADPTDADIIPDGSSGFYITASCDESVVKRFDYLKNEYDSSKSRDAVILHFSDKIELDWAKTIGGNGNDWCEEGAVDSEGNFYIAIGTDSLETDDFWDMDVNVFYPWRRVLVKLDKDGNIVYKNNISNEGLSVDQVFAIEIKDGNTYVVGMSNYFDDIQNKYPCKQITESESEEVFCVYTAVIDNKGKELDREIFRCDKENIPTGAILRDDGSVAICGSIAGEDTLPNGTISKKATLFAYKPFV